MNAKKRKTLETLGKSLLVQVSGSRYVVTADNDKSTDVLVDVYVDPGQVIFFLWDKYGTKSWPARIMCARVEQSGQLRIRFEARHAPPDPNQHKINTKSRATSGI